jgi:adenylate cyclase
MISRCKRSVLFADIVDSTRLYTLLGNNAARRLLGRAVERLVATAEARRGTVVKTIGDEAMCTFRHPNQAAAAARAMHDELEHMSVEARIEGRLNAHIGIHHGSVLRDHGDVFGDAVNVAARLAELAKPRETLTSVDTVARLCPQERRWAHPTVLATLKGKAGAFRLYELRWEDMGLTTAPLRDEVRAVAPECLRLWRGATACEVCPAKARLRIGRQPHNDFVVPCEGVSRTHAHVEWRCGRFFLVDVSTNGTHVCEEGSAGVWVKREEWRLRGRGTLGLGQPVVRDGDDTVYFEVSA